MRLIINNKIFMNKIFIFGLLIFSCLLVHSSFGQTNAVEPFEQGGEFVFDRNSVSNLTPEQYAEIERRCNENVKLLGLDTIEKSTLSVALNWPLRAKAGFNDCSFYVISAYADHNSGSGSTDYNGGTNSYNGHRGTDIATFPFHFYKMDSNQVEVIAAAAGTIIDKHDGAFDRNCAGNTDTANYVIIQHADLSRVFYWHMKSGKVTTKAIGQTVAVGEYLGVVGSSGSSSGPHLHFEVWSGSNSSTLIDPYAGINNSWNTSSWWASQKPYTEPAILKASVHTTDITFPGCDTTEIPNESTSYTIPFHGPGLSPGYAKFYIFMRNETSGTTVNMSILNPNLTVFSSWTHNCTTNYIASSWGYSKLLPTTQGTYTFQAVYNGISCSQTFDIINAISGIKETNSLSQLQVFPNPACDEITISGNDLNNGNYKFTLKNIVGQIMFENIVNVENSSLQKTFSISGLSDGIYFLSTEIENIINIRKIIKLSH